MKSENGLLYPLLGIGTLIAFVYMSFGEFSFHTEDPKLSFVHREGTQFMVDGRAFYVNGWNSYWLMDQAVEEFSRSRIGKMFQIGAKMGLTVCRTWAFNDGAYNALQVSLASFDERVFKALDHVVVGARKHGIRLILSLVNNLKHYGGKTQYVKWAWDEGIGLSSSNDSFFFDPSIRSYFKIYLKTILTRKNHLTGIEYRDDPTIFAWELMNEPQCISDASGDTLQDWIEEMAGYVKSIDRKHLLTIGLEGFYGPTSPQEKLSVNPGEWHSTVGSDFIRNSKISTIDFASVHIYPDQCFPVIKARAALVSAQHLYCMRYIRPGTDLRIHQAPYCKGIGLPGATLDEKIKYISKWVTSHIEDGERELKKPVLFTEFGLSKKNKNFDYSHRELFYKSVFDIIYESAKQNGAGAGALIWQLLVEGMEDYNDDFGFVPGERASIDKLIKEQSCRIAALRRGNDSERRVAKKIC